MDFTTENYKAFEIFNKRWALVTVGNKADFNAMTVSWGELGTLWDQRSVATVFIHPARYTSEYIKKFDTFTISFYDKKYRKALGYIGSHSGRNGDKITPSGLTPVEIKDGATFKEAELTFYCHKIYLHQFSKDGLAQEIKDYYAASPKIYPNVTPDGTGDTWEPHYVLIGEILEAEGENA